MIEVIHSKDRGHADHGWLKSQHTFSFADYHNPKMMGFRDLRVINEDRIAAGQGFGTHAHRDMEILSFVIDGQLEHKDSMGNGSIIRPGDLQYMSAGSGVSHSEFNPSSKEPGHFLQIWIQPNEKNAKPRYDQKSFQDALTPGKLLLIASADGLQGAIAIRQDIEIYLGRFDKGQKVELPLFTNRFGWLQVTRGAIHIGDNRLVAGDAARMSDEDQPNAMANANGTEFLFFDLN
jgi:redox-sensitive bicupin YhaK (pirin superfamily)